MSENPLVFVSPSWTLDGIIVTTIATLSMFIFGSWGAKYRENWCSDSLSLYGCLVMSSFDNIRTFGLGRLTMSPGLCVTVMCFMIVVATTLVRV